MPVHHHRWFGGEGCKFSKWDFHNAPHILVVDDEAGLPSVMKMQIESAGYTVDTAGNGWDGLTKLKHADYDLVLLDYMMPGIPGLTVLHHIQERHPSIPVVMMTSHTRSQVAARALAAGGEPACSNL